MFILTLVRDLRVKQEDPRASNKSHGPILVNKENRFLF